MNRIENEGNIVIIGNGISGVSAADAARKNNKHIRIIMISDESYLTYYRLRLCETITNDIEYIDSLFLHPDEWYKERNIDVILGKRVIEIFPNEKSVLLNTGESIKYNKLIIASGCSSKLPEIPGKDKKGVVSLRTLDDVKKVKENLKNTSEAIVVGGGLLGLEAAYSLKRKGMEVSIIETAPRLLSRQLDQNGSLLLEKKVKSLGINLFTGLSVKSINGRISAEEIILDNGYQIKTNFILFSAGVTPNTGFIKSSGIKVNRGIIVDQKMMTENSDIYACGDVAEFEGCMPGQWIVSLNQGKVAGINASGGEVEYSYSISPYFLNTMGIKIYSIEDIGINADIYDTLEFIDTDNFVYQKLFFIKECCVGGILIGDVENFSKINNAIKNKLGKREVISEKLIKILNIKDNYGAAK